MRLDTGFGDSSDAWGQWCRTQSIFSTGTSLQPPYFPNSLCPGFLTLTAEMTGQVCFSTEAMVAIAELFAELQHTA